MLSELDRLPIGVLSNEVDNKTLAEVYPACNGINLVFCKVLEAS